MNQVYSCPVCGSYDFELGDVQQIDYSPVKTSGDYCFNCKYSEPLNWTSSYIANAKNEYFWKVLKKVLKTNPKDSGDNFLP